MIRPSLLGLTPRSELRIASSMLRRLLLSKGVITAIRGSAREGGELVDRRESA